MTQPKSAISLEDSIRIAAEPVLLLCQEARVVGENIHKISQRTGQATPRESHLFMRLAEQIVDQVMKNADGCITAVFTRYADPFNLYQHQVTVAMLAVLQAKALNIGARHLVPLCAAALLRDIGMFDLYNITDQKLEPLTSHELNVIRTHALKGPRIARDQLNMGTDVVNIITQHHENWDGTGYPDKLAGLQINIHARLVSLADGYCAATVARPYRPAKHPVDAMRSITALAGRRYQTELVDNLVKTMGVYPLGSRVLLNTGAIGIVRRINPQVMMRPVITLRQMGELNEVDLSTTSDIFIKGKA
jgi:HD-GYP domain-containing protein (c-di-GMP phosphodiesterase class II)